MDETRLVQSSHHLVTYKTLLNLTNESSLSEKLYAIEYLGREEVSNSVVILEVDYRESRRIW